MVDQEREREKDHHVLGYGSKSQRVSDDESKCENRTKAEEEKRKINYQRAWIGRSASTNPSVSRYSNPRGAALLNEMSPMNEEGTSDRPIGGVICTEWVENSFRL